MTALALIAGFALGCGCTVALLFAVRKVAQVVGIADKPVKLEPDAETDAKNGAIPLEEQIINLMSYDGRPRKREQVSADED